MVLRERHLNNHIQEIHIPVGVKKMLKNPTKEVGICPAFSGVSVRF